MQKIISLFQRNYDGDRLVRDEVVPGAEWVLSGEGVATRKYDGTCCMVKAGKLYKRYDCKKGKKPPEGFEPAQDPDPVTGHWPGWIEVSMTRPDDKYHCEALIDSTTDYGMGSPLPDGTYELCGPKIQGNPDHFLTHVLLRHGRRQFPGGDPPRTFAELKEWFRGKDIEGIVWHHPDGRMVKIKKKDFGLKRSD